MATITYFDTLSSGMKVRIGPSSRIVKQWKEGHASCTPKEEGDSFKPNFNSRQIMRQEISEQLKLR